MWLDRVVHFHDNSMQYHYHRRAGLSAGSSHPNERGRPTMQWTHTSGMPFACQNPRLPRRHAHLSNPWCRITSSTLLACLSCWTRRSMHTGGSIYSVCTSNTPSSVRDPPEVCNRLTPKYISHIPAKKFMHKPEEVERYDQVWGMFNGAKPN